MSITENFLVNTKNFDAIIDKLRTADQLPAKVTNKFLEEAGYSNPSDLLVLHLFKDLSMLNEDGTPTDLFEKFRNKSTSKQAMAQGIVEAYVDLFKSNSLVHKSKPEDLKEEFKKFFGSSKSDLILKYMANTFLTLVEYAGRNNVEAMAEKYLEKVSGIEEVIREVAEKQRNGTPKSAASTDDDVAVTETVESPRKTINKEEKGEIDIDHIISFANPASESDDEKMDDDEVSNNSSNTSPNDVVEHTDDLDSEEEISENADQDMQVTEENSLDIVINEELEEPGEEEAFEFLGMKIEEKPTHSAASNDIKDEAKESTDSEPKKLPEEVESVFNLSESPKEHTKVSFAEMNEYNDEYDSDDFRNEEEEEEELDTESDPFQFREIMDFDKEDKKIEKPQVAADKPKPVATQKPAPEVSSSIEEEKAEESMEAGNQETEHQSGSTRGNDPVAPASEEDRTIEEPQKAQDPKPEPQPEAKQEPAIIQKSSPAPEPAAADSPSEGAAFVNKAFLKKAELLYKLGKFEEALPVLQKVIDKYGDSRESEFSDHVARALLQRASILEKFERNEEAVQAYEEIFRRYENSEKVEYYNQASNALIKQIDIMEALDKKSATSALYSKVIERLSDSDNPRYMKYVDKAYFTKVEKLSRSDNPEEAVKTLTEVIDRFMNTKEKSGFLKKAMYMKADLLEQLGKQEEALQAYDSILKTFGEES